MFTTKINWNNEVGPIQELLNAGISASEIASKYEVSRQRMSQVLKKYALLPTGKINKKKEKLSAWVLKWGNKLSSDVYQAQRQKFRMKKAAALKVGIPFTIQFGEISWTTHCPILGLELDFFAEKTQENSPSFDRINPKLGYVVGNVQIVSWRANRIKNDGSANEHRLIAEYLTKIEEST